MDGSRRKETLTVFVTTIGRKCLPICVKSFVTQAGDKMIVFGDGWDEPWAHEMGVEFRPMPKRGNWGYDHVFDALATLDTDYWMFIGDDDAFMAGQLEKLTLHGPIVSAGAYLAFPDGRNFYYPPFGPKKNFSGNWQTFYRRDVEIPRLYDDAEIFIQTASRHEVSAVDIPILQVKFPNLSKSMWDKLEFNKMAEWNPEMASWLTNESGCFKIL